MKTIFVVDDNSTNLLMAEEVLADSYEVLTMLSAATMFELFDNITPDLILLDIMMPDINGFDALRRLKSTPQYENIPVIFLTGRNDAATEALGFEMGVVDFIAKPFSRPVLLNRIKSILHMESIIRERTEMLQKQTEVLQERTEKLLRLQNSITSVLAHMVENRGKMTGEHIERTAVYIEILLKALREKGVYSEEMKDWNSDVIVLAARLHDIGKIVVPNAVLYKPDKLLAEEYDVVKTHSIEGERIIDDIISESGDDGFLPYAKILTGSHHERWDGTGYPRGLKGNDIPLQGRIMAIADVYDALVSDRPYRKALSHEEAVKIIKENRGSQFDPEITDVFLEICSFFAEVGI